MGVTLILSSVFLGISICGVNCKIAGTDVLLQCDQWSENEYCPRLYDPLCGTDNFTYNNECIFCLAAKTKSIEVLRRGRCEEVEQSNSLKMKNCDEYADKQCPMIVSPLCGSNDVSYINFCVLCKKKLELKQRGEFSEITVVHKGNCRKSKKGQRSTHLDNSAEKK